MMGEGREAEPGECLARCISGLAIDPVRRALGTEPVLWARRRAYRADRARRRGGIGHRSRDGSRRASLSRCAPSVMAHDTMSLA